VRLLKGPKAEVLDLAFSPDGRAVAAGFKHYPVFLWNLEAAPPVPVRLAVDSDYAPGGLRFSPDGRTLWWRFGQGLRRYNRDTREFADLTVSLRGVTHGVYTSADGSRAVSQHGMPDYCLIGWRLTASGLEQSWTISVADIAAESLTLSADGDLVALTTRSTLGPRWVELNPRQLEVWDAATGGFRGNGEYPYGYAPTLLFSPAAEQLVGINDMTLLVWPVPELGRPRLVRNDSRKDFTAAAFHPSGGHLYAASNDGTVQVFDAATWERVGRFSWPLGKPKSVAVSADGTLAAAGGDAGDVVIWDVDV
jgi:WD40 repeat protein